MGGMLPAERAVLLHLETFRIVLLVLHCVVVSLLALGAYESNLDSLLIGHALRHLLFCDDLTLRSVYLPPFGAVCGARTGAFLIAPQRHEKKALPTEVKLLYHPDK